jgi:hypothetical protein
VYTCKEFVDKVLIDECTKCGGFWLDSGELSSMFGADSIESLLVENLSSSEKSPMQCPKCNYEMGMLTIQDEIISKKKIFEKRISKYDQSLGNPENEPKRRGGIKFITHAIERGRKKISAIKKPDEGLKITSDLRLELPKNEILKEDEKKSFKEVIKEEKITNKGDSEDDGTAKAAKRVVKMRTIAKK